jgi:hypothetical protein
LRAAALIVLVATLAACAGPTRGAQQQRIEFAVEAVEDNILATDYSALVEITDARAMDASPPDEANDGEALVRIDYTAAVLETYRGEALETIAFSRYAARHEALEDPSRGTWIVSLCRDLDGSYYLPGVGYELPPHEAVLSVARQTTVRLDRGELPLRSNEGSYACLPDSARR